MHNHSPGQGLIECRRITSVVKKAHFVGVSCLQGGDAFQEEIALVGNPACRSRNNRKRIRPTSAKEPCVARGCFDHVPFLAFLARSSFLGPRISPYIIDLNQAEVMTGAALRGP
jgi:hypothetical protein